MDDETVIAQLGIGNLPHEMQQQTLVSVRHEVELRVIEHLKTTMSDEQLTTLDQKLKEGDMQAWRWLKSEFADVDSLYNAELTTYLDEKVRRQ